MLLMKNVPKREVIEAFARQMPEIDPSAVEACLVLLRTASDVLEALETHFGRHGISQGRFAVLMTLKKAQGEPKTPAQIADNIGVTRATITGLVDGLVKDGYVDRSPHPKDRRKLNVNLTKAGNNFLTKLLPDHFRRIAGLMKSLKKKERYSLVDLLAKVEEGITELREP